MEFHGNVVILKDLILIYDDSIMVQCFRVR